MKEFKQYLHKQKWSSGNCENEKCSRDGNVYNDEVISQESATNSDFVPGVIVKISLSKPCPDAKKLKVSDTILSAHYFI